MTKRQSHRNRHSHHSITLNKLSFVEVHLAGAYAHSLLLIARIGPMAYLGSRDAAGDDTVLLGRATRATANMAENQLLFLPLAILSFVIADADQGMALLGAQIYVIARIAYLPLYLAAVPIVRSVVFIGGSIGLFLMALALL